MLKSIKDRLQALEIYVVHLSLVKKTNKQKLLS